VSDLEQRSEVEALRARVAELEAQLARQAQETAALVAEAQEKLYWLERWHIDLDRIMRKPGAIPTLNAVRGVRQALWRAKRLYRRARGRA
jgi:hypothetical protein